MKEITVIIIENVCYTHLYNGSLSTNYYICAFNAYDK